MNENACPPQVSFLHTQHRHQRCHLISATGVVWTIWNSSQLKNGLFWVSVGTFFSRWPNPMKYSNGFYQLPCRKTGLRFSAGLEDEKENLTFSQIWFWSLLAERLLWATNVHKLQNQSMNQMSPEQRWANVESSRCWERSRELFDVIFLIFYSWCIFPDELSEKFSVPLKVASHLSCTANNRTRAVHSRKRKKDLATGLILN